MGKTAGGNPPITLCTTARSTSSGRDDCHKKFQAAPAKYLATPHRPMPSAADSVKRQPLSSIERSTAIGGAARIDALTSYAETVSQVQKRPQGEAQITTKTMWRFPDATRSERTMTMPGTQDDVGDSC